MALDRYDAKNGVVRVGTCAAHAAAITHVDWSADGLYLQSNSSDGELLFWEVPTCEQVMRRWAFAACCLTLLRRFASPPR